jgi:hypothetical protein
LAYEIGEDNDSLLITIQADDEEHTVCYSFWFIFSYLLFKLNLDFSDESGVMGYLDGEPELYETETLKKIVTQFVKRFSSGKDSMSLFLSVFALPLH